MSQTNTTGSQPAQGSIGGRSHFAAGSEIKGDIRIPGSFEILGRVDGKVTADAVVIEASGYVVGEIHAASVTIKGQFEGQILGGDVKLHAGANVAGEILYATLSIESGAQVNSNCKVKKPA
ncbi:MAG: polymer-forming cytoskeletal protein [Sedimentitalea sp.]